MVQGMPLPPCSSPGTGSGEQLLHSDQNKGLCRGLELCQTAHLAGFPAFHDVPFLAWVLSEIPGGIGHHISFVPFTTE